MDTDDRLGNQPELYLDIASPAKAAQLNAGAFDCDTPVLTANRAWATVGAICVGDEVFHPSGHAAEVVYAGPVTWRRNCYRVTTTDGRSVVVDADHLWTVTDKRHQRSVGPRGRVVRWFETCTLTTRQMVDEGLSRYATGGRTSITTGKGYATNEYRFVLPSQEPLEKADVVLPVDPYLIGAWAGDGTASCAQLTAHIDDVPHWEAAIVAAGFIPIVRRGGGTDMTRAVGITCAVGPGRQSRSFGGHLARLGMLNNKHIPDVYLLAGGCQREAVLQGLLDTDGTIDAKRGQVEFCSMSRRLADDVVFLARSLGWRATVKEGRAMLAGRDYGPKYRVCFTPTGEDLFTQFRLPRKVSRIKPVDGGKGRATLSVARIERVTSVPVRCIHVSSRDGLFLVGRDLVPTHE